MVKSQSKNTLISPLLKELLKHPIPQKMHRSYLINPAQVSTLRKKRHPDFEIILRLSPTGEMSLPVGRVYLPSLRKSHPEWFEK
ncbi:LytTR family transcriptional regulator DNA-binding domain-containing protein [Deltaproteobacteria bacterium TL4]